LKTLLQLQDLDLKIEALRIREKEIPKQKEKFRIHQERLAAELTESENRRKRILLEQKECEGEIEQKQAQVKKYDNQLLAVRKNEEYQALSHEIDTIKKQIGLKEERIISLMMEGDEAAAHLEEDRKRIAVELESIAAECRKVDEELAETVRERKALEARRKPLEADIGSDLLTRYDRIRKAKKTGPAVVPLRVETCSGCNMKVTAQVVNEIMAGDRMHTCHHCGRLLYCADNFTESAEIF
jgi:hypothetical protein